MGEKKRGRPASLPDDLITLDEAVKAIREYLAERHSPEIVEQCALTKKTLYNKRSSKELRSFKIGAAALVSKSEVLKLVS